jgi:uncharacterized protein (TIGR02145 family)
MKKLAELSMIFIIMLIAGCGTSGNDGQVAQKSVSITATQPTAWEGSGDYLEFVFDLGSPNGTSENIVVYFEASGTGLDRDDIPGKHRLQQGYIEIPPGSQTASIRIEGFTGDGTITETQTIVLRLTGCSSTDYPIGSSSEATAIIMDSDGETVTDIDGNVYHTVTIGSQVWTVENLNVDRYRNGDIIVLVQDEYQWFNLTYGAFCYYRNDTAIGNVYGKLYNWFAVNDPRGLAPAGFHIPTDAEWRVLTNYLGGSSVAGGKLKAKILWQPPNAGATNSSGFTAFPGGRRADIGSFFGIGIYGNFWSASENGSDKVWSSDLSNDWSSLFRNDDFKESGLSVRCVRD